MWVRRCGLAVAVALGCAAGPARAEPRFEPGSCAALPDVADVLPRLRCGVVRVPRDHRRPEGPGLALAVVVVASAEQPAAADPVAFVSGGPGSPLTIHAGYQARHPYAPGRDLILVDQRGTGRSEPALCPGRQAALVAGMLSVASQPTEAALARDAGAHAACHAALLAAGVDPDQFGTAITAEDFEWVRRALGVARWNVVGESYGTTVAMQLLARHPQALRSVVLDSLNPPDAWFGMTWSARVARAREAWFARCRTDAACATGGIDPAARYRAAVGRLERQAPWLAVPVELGLPLERVRLTASLFEEVVGRLIYYPSTYGDVVPVIVATGEGELGPVSAALAGLLRPAVQGGNEGAFTAVECRDRPRWREPAGPGASALDLALLPPGVCGAWSSPGPEPEVPAEVAVPTLVLAGEFDPNIGPEQSRRVAERMGARWVPVAGVGHNVRHFSACAEGIVAAFIEAPERAVDAACASGTRRPGG